MGPLWAPHPSDSARIIVSPASLQLLLSRMCPWPGALATVGCLLLCRPGSEEVESLRASPQSLPQGGWALPPHGPSLQAWSLQG